MYYDRIQTPLGDFFCIIKQNSIVSLTPFLPPHLTRIQTSLSQECQTQIDAYFMHSLTTFTLPISLQGNPFTQHIYQTLSQIPYGTTISYQNLAALADYPKAYRAAGNALNQNPILLILPCHRVIRKNGEIGGYALGRLAKKRLLDLESAFL